MRSTCCPGCSGEGRTSRLYQGLVEKGVASRVDAGSPSLRDPFLFYVSATARPGVTAEQLETALLDEVERVTTSPDHRRGAGARPAARRGRLRVPDEQRDGAGPSARLLGDDRRLALSDDVSRPDPRAHGRRHPGGGRARRSAMDTRTVGHFVPSDGGGPAAAAPARDLGPRRAAEARGPADPAAPPVGRRRRPAARCPRFTLDNGISVIVQENHATPTFALRASVGRRARSPSRAARPGWRDSLPPC